MNKGFLLRASTLAFRGPYTVYSVHCTLLYDPLDALDDCKGPLTQINLATSAAQKHAACKRARLLTSPLLRTMHSYLYLSRRLVRWMKQIHMPCTALRLRYVRMVHAKHVLMGSCTHDNLIYAMQTLLEGWARSEEERPRPEDPGSYEFNLLVAVSEVQECLAALAQAVRLPNEV